MIENAPPRSITAETYERLRDAIVDVRYKPGERLRIDALCSALSASSGAVREALSRLTAERLVIATPQRGFMVALVSRADLVELTQVRIHVECLCFEQSIRQGDLTWEANVIATHHRLHQLSSPELRASGQSRADLVRAHEAFHDALTAACGNNWWLKIRQQLFMQADRYRNLSRPVEGNRDIRVEHRALADAALARNLPQAAELMAAHLQKTTDVLLNSEFLEDFEVKRTRRAVSR